MGNLAVTQITRIYNLDEIDYNQLKRTGIEAINRITIGNMHYIEIRLQNMKDIILIRFNCKSARDYQYKRFIELSNNTDCFKS